MSEASPLVIATENPSLLLRQYTFLDAPKFFVHYGLNRAHIEKYNASARGGHQDLEAVERWMTDPDTHDTRLGIWHEEMLVGSIDLRPGSAEADTTAYLGYWLAKEHTGKGFATMAVKALRDYCEDAYPFLRAEVQLGNRASEQVLRRAGFERSSPVVRNGTPYNTFRYTTRLGERPDRDHAL